ncbi:MAG: maleylacetoacetate isomerase, partial [Pseudomonadota bacterium]
MSSELILYSYYRSSASYRARIALNLKGVPYRIKPVHLLNDGGEQRKPDYRSLNPMEQVPALVHGDQVLGQSMAIISYVDDNFDGRQLFPKTALERANCLQICETVNSGIQPLQNLSVLQYLESEFGFTAEQKTIWIRKWVLKGYAALEKTLEKTSGEFCLGNSLTAADAFLVPQVFSGRRFGADSTDFPYIQRIYNTCIEHEAFVKAAPENQPDAPKST